MKYKVITLNGIETTYPNESTMRAVHSRLLIDSNTSEYDLDADIMTIRILRGDTLQENRGSYIGLQPAKIKTVKFDVTMSDLHKQLIGIIVTVNSMNSLKGFVTIRDDLKATVLDLKTKGLIAYDSNKYRWYVVDNEQ